MKTNRIALLLFFLLGITSGYAQEKKTMSLKDAISLVISTSNEVNLANTKVATSKLELETMKNNQYPNAKISECLAVESESMKLFCNSFYAVKIQFFNELFIHTYGWK